AAEFDTSTLTGLEYYFLDDGAISPNGDGVLDETRLNFSFHDDQTNIIIELWSPVNPGPYGDGYIGYLDGGNIPAGAWYLPIDGIYMDWGLGLPAYIPDGVYTIDFNNYDTLMTMDYEPFIVKTSEPEVAFDVEEKITSSEYTVSGTVVDKFIDFKEIYEYSLGEPFDINDYLSAEYELADEDERVVDSGTLALSQDGTFEIPFSGLESGAQYLLTVHVDDVVGISAQSSTEISVPIVINLTHTPTDYTIDPVTVDVETESKADLTELKWLSGEKGTEDFAEEGNDILNEASFEVGENGIYTVYAKNESGIEGIETIEIENVTEPIEITLTPSITDYTVNPVTVGVSTESPVDLTELKWLAGERGLKDFADAGNDILATEAFEA